MSNKKGGKHSRSFPGRVKNETKTRPPIPSGFKRFADFLTLRKRKRKGDSAARQLEKAPWYHGKITAEYAEMQLRTAGEFLVREDPAMPGTCFIVVRNKEPTTLHLAITKSKSSKGTRIKYRVEDSDYTFENIPALVQFYISERRPVSIKPPAVLTIAVSKESALLNEEDFRGRMSTAGSARIYRANRGRAERKRSDPVLSMRVPSKVFEPDPDSDDLTAAINKDRNRDRDPRPHSRSNPSSMCFEEKQNAAPPGDREDGMHSPKAQSMDNVLDDEAFEPTPQRPRLLSSHMSAPSLSRKRDSGEGPPETTYDSPRSIAIPTTTLKRVSPYSKQGRKNSQEAGPLQALKAHEGIPQETYDVPTLLPSCNSRDEIDPELDYDFPRASNSVISEASQPTDTSNASQESNNKNHERDVSKNANESVTPHETAKAPPSRHEIYLNVLQKLRDAIVRPFLEYDCVTLARHMTRVDLEVVWSLPKGEGEGEEEVDPDGGAEGLEMMVLPHGRDIRNALLERYSNLTYWVGALVLAAGELAARTQIVTKLIELADALSDKLGNLVSFMAIIDGLALAQVNRLHHTWSCLHHQYSSAAILFHSTLKPLAGLLTSGAPSPFPGVCLPYVVPLARLLEMTTEEDLNDWGQDDVVQGIETLLAHMDAGRTLIQQIGAFKAEYEKRTTEELSEADTILTDYFRSRVNVGDVLGLGSDPGLRSQKLVTLLNWLSENAERASKPSALQSSV